MIRRFLVDKCMTKTNLRPGMNLNARVIRVYNQFTIAIDDRWCPLDVDLFSSLFDLRARSFTYQVSDGQSSSDSSLVCLSRVRIALRRESENLRTTYSILIWPEVIETKYGDTRFVFWKITYISILSSCRLVADLQITHVDQKIDTYQKPKFNLPADVGHHKQFSVKVRGVVEECPGHYKAYLRWESWGWRKIERK